MRLEIAVHAGHRVPVPEPQGRLGEPAHFAMLLKRPQLGFLHVLQSD